MVVLKFFANFQRYLFLNFHIIDVNFSYHVDINCLIPDTLLA